MLFRILTSCVLLFVINTGFGSCMQRPKAEKSRYGVQANNLNVNQHSPQNACTAKKYLPGHDGILISVARCGLDVYYEAQLIEARNRGCTQLPNNFPNKDFRQATPYVPNDLSKYHFPGPYFLYPISKPIFNILNTQFINWFLLKCKEVYDYDRVVLNQKCDVVSVLSEVPRLGGLVSQAIKFISRKPQVGYNQQDYNYKDCNITPKRLLH